MPNNSELSQSSHGLLGSDLVGQLDEDADLFSHVRHYDPKYVDWVWIYEERRHELFIIQYYTTV
jgi:hypothetical protein